jgi:cbb3-type cytochrome oxidase subunit 3
MKLFDLAMLARPLELLWMTALFVAIAWRALSPRRRRDHEEHAMIPLRDDNP